MRQRSAWAGLNLKENSSQIKKCRHCGAEIVWLKNRRGKWYPVNFRGLIDVNKMDFHKCSENLGVIFNTGNAILAGKEKMK